MINDKHQNAISFKPSTNNTRMTLFIFLVSYIANDQVCIEYICIYFAFSDIDRA